MTGALCALGCRSANRPLGIGPVPPQSGTKHLEKEYDFPDKAYIAEVQPARSH